MPKVLRIINRFNLGGPTYNVAYLTRYLEPEFETFLVGGMKDDTEDSSEFIVDRLGLEPTLIPEMHREINLRQDRKAYQKLRKIIREFKPDIVHTHAAKSGTLGRLAAHHEKVPVILHTFHGHVFHSYFNPLKTAFYKKVERYLAARSTRIIAISELQKHELVDIHKICPPEKMEIIPLGFDLSRFRENTEQKRKEFREKYQLEEDEIAVGIVGRLVPIKNHQLFLEGLKYVLENTTKKVRGFIIGDGETRAEVEDQARELGLEFGEGKELTFTSWIRNIDWAYAGLDVVALTSRNEGTPVSLIEAQAAGKPIVSTNVGGISNVVIPGKTALLSEVDDRDGFGKNLLTMVENGEMRAGMELAGWENVKEKFHFMRLVKDMGALYHKLLSEVR